MDIYSSSTRFPQPSLEGLKNQAKRLRSALAEDGVAISHSQSLERIAHQFGYADWNTLHALAGNTAPVFTPAIGQRVRGTYLGHPFTARIRAVSLVQLGDRYRVTLDFDEAVDVVAFEGMSAFRKRVSATIGTDGRTVEKTSNGVPQVVINL